MPALFVLDPWLPRLQRALCARSSRTGRSFWLSGTPTQDMFTSGQHQFSRTWRICGKGMGSTTWLGMLRQFQRQGFCSLVVDCWVAIVLRIWGFQCRDGGPGLCDSYALLGYIQHLACTGRHPSCRISVCVPEQLEHQPAALRRCWVRNGVRISFSDEIHWAFPTTNGWLREC